jgi:hypothetical protein
MIRSCFLWEIRFHGGTYADVVRSIKRLGVSRIEIKAADGTWVFKEPAWSAFGFSQNCAPDLIAMLREQGIQVYGWGFNYGAQPEKEGDIAATQTVALGLDGWIFDVEDQFFGYADAGKRADRLLKTFRDLCPFRSAGFSSFPLWHNPTIPQNIYWKKEVYDAAAQYCSFWEPQAYWRTAVLTEAVSFVHDAIVQHREIKNMPIVVAGRGWSDNKGKVTPDIVDAVVKQVRDLNAAGVSWWRSDLILADPLVTEAIARIGP